MKRLKDDAANVQGNQAQQALPAQSTAQTAESKDVQSGAKEQQNQQLGIQALQNEAKANAAQRNTAGYQNDAALKQAQTGDQTKT